ncbi:MAG: hypothetical protein LAT68_03705 [Cyclobacteriaceae bacterium]|nr:hypothetical protein [Cyclobacteriaceae bacterium]MCH8515415.1 hypothetical protein [Cyclobacteriaceae bacterium]
MRQITLNVEEKKYDTLLKFLETLDYVRIDQVDKQEFLQIERSFAEVKLMQEGKLPKQTLDDFLDEI